MTNSNRSLENYEKLGKSVVAELKSSVDDLVKSSARDNFDKALSKKISTSEKFADK